MYLLYLDESGNPDDAADRHFVMGGVAVFERQTFYLTRALDTLQAKHFPGTPPVDFHATQIRSGRGFWRGVDPAVRTYLLQDIGQALALANNPGVCLFTAVVEKHAGLHGEDAVKCATEEICRRFDIFLTRRANEHDDKQRGLLVFADSHYQQRAKIWVRGFRELGTQWGVLHNLSDIPYFVPARESRLIQAADFVSHAMFLLYERRDPTLAAGIVSKFDQKGGILHGLVHVSLNRGPACECPACASHHVPGSRGTWV